MTDNDAAAVLKELKAIHDALGEVALKTSPHPGQIDGIPDPQAYLDETFDRLSDAKIAEMERKHEARVQQEQHPTLDMFRCELKSIRGQIAVIAEQTGSAITELSKKG